MTPEPLISVVIATRNRSKLLVKSVRSIQEQTINEIKIIIIDDGSEDSTPEVVKSLCEVDDRISYHRNDISLGPAGARNRGIELATTEFVAIQDDDDVSIRNRLQRQMDVLTRDRSVDLVFSSVRWVNNNGDELGVYPGLVSSGRFPLEPWEVFTLMLLESNKIPNATIMFRRGLFSRMGGYPEQFSIGEDWLWFMTMAMRGCVFRAISEPLLDVLRDAGHVSLMKNYREAVRQQRGVLRSIYREMTVDSIAGARNMYRRALSNQFLREIPGCGGLRGMHRACMAVLLDPFRRDVYHRLFDTYAPLLRIRLAS